MQRIHKLLLAIIVVLAILSILKYTFNYWEPWVSALYKDTAKGQLTVGLIGVGLAAIGGAWAFFHWLVKKPQQQNKDIPTITTEISQEYHPQELQQFYYDDLIVQCQRYDLGYYRDSKKLSEQSGLQAHLSDVYVDLEAHPVAPKGSKSTEKDNRQMMSDNKEQSKFLLNILEEAESSRMVLRGDVGSGKSSFINFLSYNIATSNTHQTPALIDQAWLRRPVARLLLREVGAELAGDTNGMHIIFEQIRKRITQHIENTLSEINVGGSCQRLTQQQQDRIWDFFLPEFLKHGVLILDGLDEVAKENKKRKNLLKAIHAFAHEAKHQNINIILTSRNQAYGGDDQLSGFNLFQLDDLSPEKQVPRFIHYWYKHAASAEDYKHNAEDADQLIAKIQHRPSLKALTKTPLLLTLILVLDSTSIQLPESRSELYDNAVKLLLDRWHRQLLKYKKSLSSHEQQALEILEQDPKLLESAMQTLALETYKKAEGIQKSDETIIFGKEDVESALKKHLETSSDMGFDAQDSCHDFLRFRSQILKAEADKISFMHKSFHEYLAAKEIMRADLSRFDELSLITATADKRAWWREVFLFAINIGKAEFLLTFISSDILPRQYGSQKKGTLVNILGLLNLTSHAAQENKLTLLIELEGANERLQQVYQGLQGYIRNLWNDPRLDIQQKAQLGRSWGRFGDTRSPGITWQTDESGKVKRQSTSSRNYKLPDIDWVTIPSGDFMMGSDPKDEEAYHQEQPAHSVHVNEFKISRYPITNAQYRCFVDSGAYGDTDLWDKLPQAAKWWQEGGEADQKLLDSIKNKDIRESCKNWLANDTARHEPRYWNDPKWNLDNHPVVGISWFEALAFTTWLNEQEGTVSKELILPNSEIRLPTEEEWEYGARGSKNLNYSWGNKVDKTKGNYDDTGLNQTSPVGMFAEGSAFELHDMSGNTWEWTSSRWGNDASSPKFKYKDWKQQVELAKRNDLEPTEFRIMRGGSWDFNSRYVRPAIRFSNPPGNRNYRIGFRVVYGVLPGLDSAT